MTRDEFEAAARRGKLNKATGRAVEGEEETQTGLGMGLVNGYSQDDIAHFYASRRGAWTGMEEIDRLQGYDPFETALEEL